MTGNAACSNPSQQTFLKHLVTRDSGQGRRQPREDTYSYCESLKKRSLRDLQRVTISLRKGALSDNRENQLLSEEHSFDGQ
jgi:hypothetical protein